MRDLLDSMDTTPVSQRSPERLPMLDGMRGIAALCVLGFHVQEMFHFHGPFGRSYLFVDFFFLLSGFVLGLVAEPRMLAGKSWSSFMASRWRRLWPMIAIGAVLGAVPFSMGHDLSTTALFVTMAVLMLPVLSPSYEPYPLNGPQWSLLMEFLVNLAHGVLFVRLSLRRLVLLNAVLGAALLALIFRNTSNFWLLAELRVGFSYTLGLVFARCRLQGRLCQSERIDWRLPILLASGAVVALPFLPLTKNIGDSLMIFAVFPAAILGAVIARAPAAANAVLLGLGRLSYPLYTIHFPLAVLIRSYGQTFSNCVLTVVVSLALAAVLAALMERPRRRGPGNAAAEAPAIA